jgi:glycosyltransferase involved in cell wall biosynthesis
MSHADASPAAREVGPPLRVRTRKDYSVPFLVDAGQRNAVFVRRKWTPLRRVLPWADAFAILPEPDFDIVHAVNAVPILTRRPYVLTFEDYLPRTPEDRYVGWLERALQRTLLSDRCVGLVAISEYALRQFRRQAHDFAEREALEAKLQLLYPAIAPRRSTPKAGFGGAGVHLVFVGHDYLRKGGPALLDAHEALRAAGVPVRTTVVSTLRWAPEVYIGPPDTAYVQAQHARLATTPGVTHRLGLPNAQALALMDDADFLVFPTLHDTFGYVSLEAMATGTPVLASATCAQPEVVEHGVSGFLLAMDDQDPIGRWAWTYRTAEPGYMDAYRATMAALGGQIAEHVAAVWDAGPERYAQLSAGALARVAERFGQERLRVALEQLYEQCRAYAAGGRQT